MSVVEEITLDVRNMTAQSDNLSTIRSMIISRAVGTQDDAQPTPPRCLRKVKLVSGWEEEVIWTNIIKDFHDLGLTVEMCRFF